jgi:hypothetical protein
MAAPRRADRTDAAAIPWRNVARALAVDDATFHRAALAPGLLRDWP